MYGIIKLLYTLQRCLWCCACVNICVDLCSLDRIANWWGEFGYVKGMAYRTGNLTLKLLGNFCQISYFLISFPITLLCLYESCSIQWPVWCSSTRASLPPVLSKHPQVSSCSWVQSFGIWDCFTKHFVCWNHYQWTFIFQHGFWLAGIHTVSFLEAMQENC